MISQTLAILSQAQGLERKVIGDILTKLNRDMKRSKISLSPEDLMRTNGYFCACGSTYPRKMNAILNQRCVDCYVETEARKYGIVPVVLSPYAHAKGKVGPVQVEPYYPHFDEAVRLLEGH